MAKSCFSFDAENSNETQHIYFWYVKHKNKKLPMKKLNTSLAVIEKTLLRHPNALCLSVNISKPTLSPLGL